MTLSFLAQAIANLLPPITPEIFNLTQLGDDLVGEYTHVALQHPFLWLHTPASEFMRSHRRPALHRCNAHCCKGCRARSFYCHPWSGQSTNLNKSSYSYARVRCRCLKVAMVIVDCYMEFCYSMCFDSRVNPNLGILLALFMENML